MRYLLKVVFNNLDATPLRTDVRIVALDLAPELTKWLSAIGLEAGVTARVLRRALWGGPLHLKLSTGGELAIHASLARAIRVELAPAGAKATSTRPAARPSTSARPTAPVVDDVATAELGYPAPQ